MPVRSAPTLKGSDGKPFTITINEFKGGNITLLDESRLPNTAVTISQNMMLDQDGVWRTRDGSKSYGKTLVGPIEGLSDTVVVYNSDGTNTNYVFVMDNGSVKYSQDGGTWTTIAGRTWTTGYTTTFKQIASRLYVTNGKETRSYIDLTTMYIKIYTPLSTPSAPTLAKTGLAGSTYTYYYKITAVNNQIGETAASAEANIAVGKQRIMISSTTANWTSGTDSVTLSWPAVTNADSYNIYISDQTGQEVYLDSVNNTNLSYTDTGTQLPNIYQVAPPTDGTSGPTISQTELSGNRIWGTGDSANPYRIVWTGTGQYLGSFNPYFGGGYIDLEKGGAEHPVSVKHFRDGKGNAVAVVLTSNPSGGGSRWFITLTTLTVDSLSIVVPQATKEGNIGTASPRGVVVANNNVYYPSVKGFQSLGSTQNILNVLQTTEISANIRPTVRNLTNSAMSKICGFYYYGRIYWSVPYGSTTNNQTWVLDLERGAWCQYWSIGVKQFAEYTDSSGTIHLLAIPVTGTNLIEFSSTYQGDSGIPFNIDLESGLISWDKDHSLWARVDKVYVELGHPKGNINFAISGTQKSKSLALLKSISITDTISTSGVGSDLVGDFIIGDTGGIPVTYSQSSVKKRLLVRKRLNNMKWTLTSSDINASFTLLEVVIKGKILPTSDPSLWK